MYRQPLTFSIEAAPKPMQETSVVSVKGLLKSGKARIGDSVKSFLSELDACSSSNQGKGHPLTII